MTTVHAMQTANLSNGRPDATTVGTGTVKTALAIRAASEGNANRKGVPRRSDK